VHFCLSAPTRRAIKYNKGEDPSNTKITLLLVSLAFKTNPRTQLVPAVYPAGANQKNIYRVVGGKQNFTYTTGSILDQVGTIQLYL
jgi:hypothetical protein